MAGPVVEHRHLDRIGYRDALALQRSLWRRVVDRTGPEAVLTLEHDPVVTIGRRGTTEHLRLPAAELEARGVDVVETDRGGELTYHGPGQLVVYPILAVRERGIHVGDLVRGVNAAVAEVLSELGITAVYDPDRPGLWAGEAKIGAVGMRVSQGVSMHGTAVNLTTDLDAFAWIVPCGMPEARATSVRALGIPAPSPRAFGDSVVAALAARFGLEVRPADG